jgi:hypothetical protein
MKINIKRRNKKMKWKFNLDADEIWYGDEFDTKEEAIQAGIKKLNELKKIDNNYKDVNSFYVGQVQYYTPCISPEWLIEQIGEMAYDECGEVAEDWLRFVKNEKVKQLGDMINKVFMEWLKDVGEMPTFGSIVNIEEIKIE